MFYPNAFPLRHEFASELSGIGFPKVGKGVGGVAIPWLNSDISMGSYGHTICLLVAEIV